MANAPITLTTTSTTRVTSTYTLTHDNAGQAKDDAKSPQQVRQA